MTEEKEIMSHEEVPMTWSMQDRVRHLVRDLKSTKLRPQDGYGVALRQLKYMLRSAGLSYAVLRTHIWDQEYRVASDVLQSGVHLVEECEHCSEQSNQKRSTHEDEATGSDGTQDKQSTNNNLQEGEEDVEALLAKWFPRKRRIFETPSESLMYYCKQLSDQTGWKAYMASTDEPPQSSWEDVYSHLIEYLQSILATQNGLLLDALARYFEPKKPSKLRTKRVFGLLDIAEEHARSEGATLFFERMRKNVIVPPRKEPEDWCSAAYAVLTEMVDLIGPNDENPNYLANLYGWHKLEQCMSLMPYEEKHTSKLLSQFQNQEFTSVAEMSAAIKDWHDNFRADNRCGTMTMKVRGRNK